MKKILLFLLLCSSLAVRSQDKESFYVFDANWKPTKLKTAHFFLHTYPLNDTCWQYDFYNFAGPLLGTEQYWDKEGKDKNGVAYHYNEKGRIDSMANFRHGKLEGESYKLSGDSLKHHIRYLYRNDTLIEKVDLDTVKKVATISFKDEKESEFPGGLKAWYKYLSKNIKYPDRAVSGTIQGQVIIRFIVDKDGNVVDPSIAASVEYSIDTEALRIIKNSGRWVPAFQNGHNVKSYKQQPINFQFQ